MKNRLRELRETRKLYQKDMAQLLNVAVSTYSYWEKGTYEPDQEVLTKLADFFNVSVDYLLGREEKKPPENQEDKNRLYVPEQYRDVMVAFQDGAENLTQEDIDAVVNFIEYMKSKKK